MATATVEFEGVKVEVGSVLYCSWDQDHAALAEEAREVRARLGHNVDESLVLCMKCLKAVPLKS